MTHVYTKGDLEYGKPIFMRVCLTRCCVFVSLKWRKVNYCMAHLHEKVYEINLPFHFWVRLWLSDVVCLIANDASKGENKLVVMELVTSEPVSYIVRHQQPWAYP
jgi:hypothetical protein